MLHNITRMLPIDDLDVDGPPQVQQAPPAVDPVDPVLGDEGRRRRAEIINQYFGQQNIL